MEQNKAKMTPIRWVLFGINIALIAAAFGVAIWPWIVAGDAPWHYGYAAVLILFIPLAIIMWPLQRRRYGKPLRRLALGNFAFMFAFLAFQLLGGIFELPLWLSIGVWVAFTACMSVFWVRYNKLEGEQRAQWEQWKQKQLENNARDSADTEAAQETKGETLGDGTK